MTSKIDDKNMPCRIRRAVRKEDLTEAFNLILDEPRHRLSELVPTVLFNFVVLSLMLSASFTVIVVMMTFENVYSITQFQIQHYILGMLLPSVIVFGLAYIQAWRLFNRRYTHIRELNSNLDESTVTTFLSSHQIYLAYAHKKEQDLSKSGYGPLLGMAMITPYGGYCTAMKLNPIMPTGFEKHIANTVLIPWLVVNENLLRSAEKINIVYKCLLEYIAGGRGLDTNRFGVLCDTTVEYVVTQTDDYLYWQHALLHENDFSLCGNCIDLLWCNQAYPCHRYYFFKPLNRIALELAKQIVSKKERQFAQMKQKQAMKEDETTATAAAEEKKQESNDDSDSDSDSDSTEAEAGAVNCKPAIDKKND